MGHGKDLILKLDPPIEGVETIGVAGEGVKVGDVPEAGVLVRVNSSITVVKDELAAELGLALAGAAGVAHTVGEFDVLYPGDLHGQTEPGKVVLVIDDLLFELSADAAIELGGDIERAGRYSQKAAEDLKSAE